MEFNETSRRVVFGSGDRMFPFDPVKEVTGSFFRDFIQSGVDGSDLRDKGLHRAFNSVFPIFHEDSGTAVEYVSYRVGDPLLDLDVCLTYEESYEVPLYATFRLTSYTKSKDSLRVVSAVEKEFLLGNLPMMTESGTFIRKGKPWVVVSQTIRSDGIYSEGQDSDDRRLRIAPRTGPHLMLRVLKESRPIKSRPMVHVDFSFDGRKWLPVTYLLFAMGMSPRSIVNTFYPNSSTWCFQYSSKGNSRVYREDRSRKKYMSPFKLAGYVAGLGNETVMDGEVLDNGSIAVMIDDRVKSIDLLDPLSGAVDCPLMQTLRFFGVLDRGASLMRIYRENTDSGDDPKEDDLREFFSRTIFNRSANKFSPSGIRKISRAIGKELGEDAHIGIDMVCSSIKLLLDGTNIGGGIFDLVNRQARTSAGIMESYVRLALTEIRDSMLDQLRNMKYSDRLSAIPDKFVVVKPLNRYMKEFCGSSSSVFQFADQTNSISETMHKLRITMTGPDGMEQSSIPGPARYIVTDQFGRISPLETPDGPKIGVDNAIALYAKFDERTGYLTYPAYIVNGGELTDVIVDIDPVSERSCVMCSKDMFVDGVLPDNVTATIFDTASQSFIQRVVDSRDVTHAGVMPNMMLSLTASLIPFLEHNEGVRVSMGANMQKQAVPLIRPTSPVVGTGLEAEAARISESSMYAKHSGIVHYSDGDLIVVRRKWNPLAGDLGIDMYRLPSFGISNNNMQITYRPAVTERDKLSNGDLIADGICSDRGELALGRNIRVAFMTWYGYGYEDAIVISERLVKDDVFNSVHLRKFECIAYSTEFGAEEITSDIPDISARERELLDEYGLPRLGIEVKSGDILVGKVTPKDPNPAISPEDRLIRKLFDRYADPFRNSSLYVPNGIDRGKVIDVQVFSSDEEDTTIPTSGKEQVREVKRKLKAEFDMMLEVTKARLVYLLDGEVCAKTDVFRRGKVLRRDDLEESTVKELLGIEVKNNSKLNASLKLAKKLLDVEWKKRKTALDQHIASVTGQANLGHDKLKKVVVTIAEKRNIQVGDKLSGRHGNKGVISIVVPEEDMPYDEEGRSVDVILSPLGVPSRMNPGQLFEVHLGEAANEVNEKLRWLNSISRKAAKEQLQEIVDVDVDDDYLDDVLNRGLRVASPPFDGASEEDINKLAGIEEESLNGFGSIPLYDGYTGQKFDRPVTVGCMYMMKLNHMVTDKIHARSVGPYNRITQQPLKGKANFGGQRLGEMEVWALEAYGAAYNLQEMMTLKSDHIKGRDELYKKIVDGNGEAPRFKDVLDGRVLSGKDNSEAFKVMLHEIRGLALDMDWR